MSVITNLIRKKTNNKIPTALCCFYDGRFDSQLADIGIKLIGDINTSLYSWVPESKSPNIQLVSHNDIPKYAYDFVICNDLIKQREQLINYTKSLHLPGLVINHEQILETKYHIKNRLLECNSEMISTQYGSNDSILYGTTEIPNIDKDIDVLLEGNFQPNDDRLLQSLKQSIPSLTLVGNNPNIDFSITPTSFEEYRKYFARCKIFLNLPTQRTLSHQLLWAMSNGALIVSLKAPFLTNVLNSDNSILCSTPSEATVVINRYLNKNNPQSENAKQINQLFPLETFKAKWKSVLQEYTNRIYMI